MRLVNAILSDLTGGSRYTGISEDRVGGLFGDHVNRTDDKKAWNAGKDGSIHDPKTLRTVNAKITCKNAIFITRTNGTT